MAGIKCAHVRVSGMVQGVFFRANTKRMADSLHLSGWVRNLPDGRVEAVFEGNEYAVRKAVSWCREGPIDAHVDDVEITWEPPHGFQGFEVKY